MKKQARIYQSVVKQQLAAERQMVFLAGPRQVGKTTVCRALADVYLDWDNMDHRTVILDGPAAVARYAGLDIAAAKPVVIAFDELHRFSKWKLFLKGFFDTYEDRCRIIVTGSSSLDTYRRGGDSLMGRYFLYHMHPFSVAEIVRPELTDSVIRSPVEIRDKDWRTLLEYGGFPEPFVKHDTRFSRRWQKLRQSQLLREDIRDLTRIQELDQLAVLAELLANRSSDQLIYSNLAGQVRVSENTIRSWIGTLISLHYGFAIRPWYKNVSRSLRKEPKWYMRDWSGIKDAGKRAETCCACHLLKAVQGWTDMGLGDFELCYIRDKEKREVDFVVVRDRTPWFLVEVKQHSTDLSPALGYFKKEINCPHAFQVVMDLAGSPVDSFNYTEPIVVSARSFLSQLL